MSAAEAPRLPDLIAEAQRMLAICNACRYCEGFCAVFPALERRLAFDEGDVHYLANLCHNCGSCLYACQYAPPHEFQVNFPKALAQVRAQSYRRYAWPRFLARVFERNGLVASLATGGSLAAMFAFIAWQADPGAFMSAHPDSAGAFYAVLPHGRMALLFAAAFAFALVALVAGFARFWADTGESIGELAQALPLRSAAWDAAGLKYLDGGGDGCTYPRSKPSFARRQFHHFTFYGFALCFAATAVATIYHYVFGWKAPYPWFSLPVLLGVLGGIGLLIGPAGLAVLKWRSDPQLTDEAQAGMDFGFLALLFLTSATGLGLLFWRESAAMGILLATHLGVVLALFVTLPYGKFVHAVYRLAALIRFHVERRRPLPQIGAE